MDYKSLKVGDKVEYMGEYEDDNLLYEQLEKNDSFNLVITQIEEESELCWSNNVDYAIQLALVRKLT